MKSHLNLYYLYLKLNLKSPLFITVRAGTKKPGCTETKINWKSPVNSDNYEASQSNIDVKPICWASQLVKTTPSMIQKIRQTAQSKMTWRHSQNKNLKVKKYAAEEHFAAAAATTPVLVSPPTPKNTNEVQPCLCIYAS